MIKIYYRYIHWAALMKHYKEQTLSDTLINYRISSMQYILQKRPNIETYFLNISLACHKASKFLSLLCDFTNDSFVLLHIHRRFTNHSPIVFHIICRQFSHCSLVPIITKMIYKWFIGANKHEDDLQMVY